MVATIRAIPAPSRTSGLSHIGKATGKLLLANPDWDFGIVLHPAIAESQLKDGRASISSQGSLFNAAAEQALRRRSGSAQVPQG